MAPYIYIYTHINTSPLDTPSIQNLFLLRTYIYNANGASIFLPYTKTYPEPHPVQVIFFVSSYTTTLRFKEVDAWKEPNPPEKRTRKRGREREIMSLPSPPSTPPKPPTTPIMMGDPPPPQPPPGPPSPDPMPPRPKTVDWADVGC